MKLRAVYVMFILYFPLPLSGQRLVPPRNYQADDDDDDPPQNFQDEQDEDRINATGILTKKKRGVWVQIFLK